jgi:hypothetical protein
MECETEAAFKTAEMVPQYIRIVSEVSSFILEHSDPLLAQLLEFRGAGYLSCACFGSFSVLPVHFCLFLINYIKSFKD